jgi:arylsulfatase A-like enzyme
MRRSLLLITVDCLRADHVGFLGYRPPTTPFLDSLAKESFTFSNAIAAGVPTYYSFPAILASRHALALGRDVIGLAPGEANLASSLRDAGYATAAFVAANPYLSSRFGYDQGFEIFKDFLKDAPAEAEPVADRSSSLNRKLAGLFPAHGRLRQLYDGLYFQYCQRIASPAPQSLDALRRFPTADVLVDEALAWIETLPDTPFFLWLHLMDPHSPYYPQPNALEAMGRDIPSPSHARYTNACWNRENIAERQRAKYRDEIVQLYDAGIRWVDLQIARLANALQGLGRWTDCVMAVTADHGEEFLEHGGSYHAPSVYEELIRVPLLVRMPRMNCGKFITSPFSLLHLAPTILEALELPVPPSFQGSSYWPHLLTETTWKDAAVVECVSGCTNPFHAANRVRDRILAVRDSRFKLVFDFRNQREELFDLEVDPEEKNPLPPEVQNQARQRLLNRARQHLLESHQLRRSSHRIGARLRDIRLELASSAH